MIKRTEGIAGKAVAIGRRSKRPGDRPFYEQFAIPAESFARAVAFAISQPKDVDINEILFRPRGRLSETYHPPKTTPMTQTKVPTIRLNNGVDLPALGFGVFQSAPAETSAAVESALGVGYRLIDTAAAYFNEREVGEGIRRSGVSRDEAFIQTKVWISDYGYDETLHAFEKSVRKLGVDRLDLLLLHQPLSSAFDRTIDAYRALEKLLADGNVRAIGVSNFMPDRLEQLLRETSVVPAVNQIELHPYFQQKALQRLHEQHGIATQAWSPIGGITSYVPGRKSALKDLTLGEIAKKHGKSTAQVMLRWHVQEGRSAIPKSVKPARIAENFDVFDFELARDELAMIDALDTGVRGGPEPDTVTLENYGKTIPEA
jgi:diketogulonate reductase-like aldo/keto reductase